MIRAILCKLIFGFDPNQVQADIRNLTAHKDAVNSRVSGLEHRVNDVSASATAINGRFTGRAV